MSQTISSEFADYSEVSDWTLSISEKTAATLSITPWIPAAHITPTKKNTYDRSLNFGVEWPRRRDNAPKSSEVRRCERITLTVNR